MGKTKVCTKCGKRKSVRAFSVDKSKKDGLKTQCKSCMNAADAERRAKRKAEKEKAQRLESSKKRLAETKKSFKKVLDEEANRKTATKADELIIDRVVNAMKTSVQSIADIFSLEAEVMVKLKPIKE